MKTGDTERLFGSKILKRFYTSRNASKSHRYLNRECFMSGICVYGIAELQKSNRLFRIPRNRLNFLKSFRVSSLESNMKIPENTTSNSGVIGREPTVRPARRYS